MTVCEKALRCRLAFHLQGTSVLIRKASGDDGMYKVRSCRLHNDT